MTPNASISVIIPFYNSANTIERAITSVLLQTLLPREIIVIDDKSSEESILSLKKVFEKYREQTAVNLILLSMKENVGAGCARNHGWANSSEKYIAFLDADDSWLPQKLEFQYSFFEKDDSLMLCGHKYIVVESPSYNMPNNSFDQTQYNVITQKDQLFKNRFATSTVMLRTSLRTRFLKKKRYAEDFLLWSEIISQKNKAIKLNSILAFYYKPAFGDSGLSSNMLEMYRGELETYEILYRKKYIRYYSLLLYKKISLIKYKKRSFTVFCREIYRKK